MYNNVALTIAADVGTAAELAIVAVILWRKLVRDWPSLLVYATLSLAVDAAMYVIPTSDRRYFFLFWGWIATAALIRLWVMIDVLRSFPGGSIVGRQAPRVVFFTGLSIATGACCLSLFDLKQHHRPFIGSVTLIDAAVNYAWAAFLVTILGAIWFSMLGWSRQGSAVAAGASLKVGTATITAYLVATASKPIRHAAITANSIFSMLAIVVWLVAICLRNETFDLVTSAPHTEKEGHECM